MPCPNKNLESWKSLVEALESEAQAHVAYTLNDYDIPSIEEAKILLASYNAEESSVTTTPTSKLKSIRLERVNSQIEIVNRVIKSAPKDARLETLNKIKNNLEAYRKVIEEGQVTVSVSNLFAGGELEDQEMYKNYADFGTFQHHILESLQLETLGTTRSLTSVFTRKKLKDLLDSYPNKFTIKGLIDNGTIGNEDELYNMSVEVLGILQNYTSMGYTILPEISILAKDRFNKNIVGRLDMLAVNSKGSVTVIDLKSKKLKSTASVDSLSYYWRVNDSPQTDAEFRGGTRNAYENWDIQLGIYARMLQQLDINTDEKRILGLFYYGAYTNPEGKQFDEKGEDTFEYQFYHVKSYISSELGKAGENDFLRYKSHMRKIAKVLPLTEEDVTSPKEKDKDEFAFNLSAEESVKLVDKLKEISLKETRNARTALSEARKKDSGKDIIAYYEERLETLDKIRKALDQDNWEAPYKVGFVIRTLEIDTKNLADTVLKLKIYTGVDGLVQRAKDLERLNKRAVGYNIVTTQVRQMLMDANVDNESRAMTVLNNINNNISRVRSEYTRIGFRFTMDLLKNSLSGIQITRISDQRKQFVADEIAYLKRKKDSLVKDNKDSGLWHRISNPVANIINSAMKADINPKTELEKIEFQIEKLELEMEGVKLDDDSLKKYIEAVVDPTSPAYIGQGTSYFTQFIAGSSSADWLNSAFATKLKMALATGTQEFVNFVEREKIQQEFDAYKVGERNVNKLNEPISEVRTVKQFDMNGNETTVQRRGFVNPLTQEYYDIIDTYKNEYRKLYRQIRDLSDNAQRKELKGKLRELTKSHLEWRLANTQMEYVDEIYELDKLLPEEYKQERDELYEEKRLLENSAGFNNAEDLDESVIFRIAEIEVELNKLRKKYADMQEGGYARYLELQERFYDYEINYNYFNRLFNQKKIELTDINDNLDVEALAKWKEQNMIKRPKGEWYEVVGSIWDEIFMIIGKDNPAVEGLKDKYKEILKQYRRRGAVDSRFMSQEDIDVLNEIEKLIQIYKMASPSRGLTFEDRIALTELFKSLEVVQTRIENPFYIKEFNSRLDELELAWNNYQTEKEESVKERYLEQFLIKEIDFKTWYDNNHTNKYVSKLVSKEALNPLPKKYNMMTVPTSEEMMEEVPDYKFTKRVLLPTAYNLNYQEDNLGYAMPKGLMIDGADVTGNSQWLNPKYEQIRNNPRLSKFYHSFVGRFLDMQKQTTGKLLGYNFPGYEQASVDDVALKGVKDGVKNRMKMFRDKNLVIGTDYDFSINGYGTQEEDRIQFKHNTPLPIEQQTTDGIAAVIRWYEQAHVNKAMAEQQAMSKSIIGYMESLYEQLSISQFEGKQKRMKDLRTVIDQMNFEYDKFIKGEWKTDQGMAGRFGDLVLKGVGFTRLALDVPNQLGNMLSGNVQAFLGTHKSGLYSGRNYLWAKSKIESRDGLVGSLLRDYDKIGNKSFMTKMLLYWNPLQESLDHYYNRTRSTGDRLKQGFFDGNFNFFIQDKGELEISSTIWLSILDNVKVKVVKTRDENGNVTEYEKDENGNIKVVNVFEAYTENSNGEIVIRPDVEWTKKDEEATQRSVWSEIRRTQGRYAEWDKAKIESGILGRMLLFYRKYLEPFIRNRFGRRESNWEAGVEAYGFYRALLKSFKIYGTKQTLAAIFGFKNTGVSEAYQQKSQMAMRELATAAMLYIIGRMLVGAMPDDDDDDRTLAKTMAYNLMAVYAKVDMETRSMVPMIVIGDIDNYFQNFTSFTNIGRDAGNVADMFDHGFFLGISQFVDETSEFGEFVDKRAYYQRKTKLFDKGDAKIKKDIMNLTGYMNMFELFNPEDRFKNYKARINN
jgi:hypothetical protein